MEYNEEFNLRAQAQADQKRQIDFDDLQREMSGIDNGRLARFLSPEAREAIRNGRTGIRGGDKLSALDLLLLQDQQYASFYTAAMHTNDRAREQVESLQERIKRAVNKANQQIESTLDQAASLPDGNKAFMDKDGKVFTADDELVDPAIAEGIDFDDRPTREAYQSQIKARDEMLRMQTEAGSIELRIGERRNALEDRDDPLTKQELKDMREDQDLDIKRLEVMKSELSAVESAFTSRKASFDSELEQDISLSKPSL